MLIRYVLSDLISPIMTSVSSVILDFSSNNVDVTQVETLRSPEGRQTFFSRYYITVRTDLFVHFGFENTKKSKSFWQLFQKLLLMHFYLLAIAM